MSRHYLNRPAALTSYDVMTVVQAGVFGLSRGWRESAERITGAVAGQQGCLAGLRGNRSKRHRESDKGRKIKGEREEERDKESHRERGERGTVRGIEREVKRGRVESLCLINNNVRLLHLITQF